MNRKGVAVFCLVKPPFRLRSCSNVALCRSLAASDTFCQLLQVIFFFRRGISHLTHHVLRIAGDAQSKKANLHFDVTARSRKTSDTHRLLRWVRRRLTDNEAEASDTAVLTVVPAPREQNTTERVEGGELVSGELPASLASVTDMSADASSSQPSTISPDADSELLFAEEAPASLQEVSFPVSETIREAPLLGMAFMTPAEFERNRYNEANATATPVTVVYKSPHIAKALANRQVPDVQSREPKAIDHEGDPPMPIERGPNPSALAAAISRATPLPGRLKRNG